MAIQRFNKLMCFEHIVQNYLSPNGTLAFPCRCSRLNACNQTLGKNLNSPVHAYAFN